MEDSYLSNIGAEDDAVDLELLDRINQLEIDNEKFKIARLSRKFARVIDTYRKKHEKRWNKLDLQILSGNMRRDISCWQVDKAFV